MTHTVCQILPTMAAAAVSALLAASAAGQPRLPRLRYEPPADLMHSALGPPENYESSRISASLQVYAFRAATSDVPGRFQQTLLRDWIAPQYQEGQLVAPPTFGTMSVPGAEGAYYAQFAEPSFAGPRPRLRVLVVARGAAAVVDAQAASLQAWQVAQASFNALIATLRVDDGGATRPRDSGIARTCRAVRRDEAEIRVRDRPGHRCRLRRVRPGETPVSLLAGRPRVPRVRRHPRP